MGLVAYNIAKQVLNIPQLEFHEVRSYPEYFPNIAIVENGHLSTQALRLYRALLKDDLALYVLNGPQPGSDELQAMFIEKFTADLLEINEEEPIKLYISFGAFITSMQVPVLDPVSITPEEYIDGLINKDRRLFVATCGGIELDNLEEILNPTECQLVQEENGYITGLNGVLPAVVGEMYGIPAVTIMVETENFEFIRATSHLSQFLGVLGTKKGMEYVIDAFDQGAAKNDILQSLNRIIAELRPLAVQQLEHSLEQEQLRKKGMKAVEQGKDYI